MIVYLNGQFLSEDQATLPISDRGFLYGDGLFETLRIFQGQPFRWAQHWHRFQEGARFVGLPLPLTAAQFHGLCVDLARRNQMPEAMLRFTLSAGSGPRGYARPKIVTPTVLATLSVPPSSRDGVVPEPWHLIISRMAVVSPQKVSGYKTCSRLGNVLARTEAAAAEAHEALLLNDCGKVAEGAASNVFWWSGDQLQTPPLASGALPGVTRSVVFELCAQAKISLEQKSTTPADLSASEGVFLSLSSSGIVAAASLDGQPLAQSDRTLQLQHAYSELIKREVRQMALEG